MSTPPPAFDLSDETTPRSQPVPEFDLTPNTPPVGASRPAPRGIRVRGMGCLGALPVLLLLLKLGSVGKILVPLLSFFASIWFYTKLVPGGAFWLFFGIFLMIFLHEGGHALAARRFGLKYEGMLFTPFGGVVFHRPGDTNVVQDAFIGIMGPVVGAICAVVASVLGLVTGNKLFLSIAASCFAINMANLVPGGPLDGGWIGAVFHRKLSPRFESIRAEQKSATYFTATSTDKIKYGFAWAALALFLLAGTIWCRVVLQAV
jgi:Zn-dependent protease